jgi:hypothetical protein
MSSMPMLILTPVRNNGTGFAVPLFLTGQAEVETRENRARSEAFLASIIPYHLLIQVFMT